MKQHYNCRAANSYQIFRLASPNYSAPGGKCRLHFQSALFFKFCGRTLGFLGNTDNPSGQRCLKVLPPLNLINCDTIKGGQRLTLLVKYYETVDMGSPNVNSLI
jgi:hypothetical protein